MPVSNKRSSLVPYWQSDCERAVVYVGDNLDVMARMDRDQFHAVVTDPPYNLGFMNKEFDTIGDGKQFQQWLHTRAEQMLRVAKPGAHLLSFGGTRMWHRMACAVEDAGWEIRDTVMWVYGSGFPKGQDISKAIDKQLGVERKTVETINHGGLGGQFKSRDGVEGGYGYGENWDITQPATDEAKQWAGWSTALKPAVEPIILARRPFAGTVADCVMANGAGAMNIDGCRVGADGGCKRDGTEPHTLGVCGNVLQGSVDGSLAIERSPQKEGLGRWPANFIHDGSDEAVGLLPDGADRYFYTAKADDSDRQHGGGTVHPTVKPLDLMRYLVRLVCARGGMVLDPFMGSGSTGCAAIAEGMYFVGIEQSAEYADIAVDRLKEMLGVHPHVERLASGKRVVKDTPPPPKMLR